MLDQNDIKQIDAVVTKRIDDRFAVSDKKLDERFAGYDKKLDERFVANNNIVVREVVLQVGEFIEQHVLPQIDAVQQKLATLPDKDFVSRQTVEVKVAVIAHIRAQNDKVNLLISFLREQKVLSDDQFRRLQELTVFPTLDTLPV